MKFIIIALTLFLAGCATSDSQVEADIGAGQPPQYQAGYRDGCDTGLSAAGNPYYHFHKDVAATSSDPLYASGWQDGLMMCRDRYQTMMNILAH